MPAARKPPPGKGQTEQEPPEVEQRIRTPRLSRLEVQIQSIYIMVGGAMSVIPPQMAGERLRLIGRSFSIHSPQIAEAWIDLCEEDKRVLRAWESLTGFSAWGKVVGRHLEAVGDVTPAVQGRREERQPTTEPFSGSAEDDLAAAAAIANFFAQQQAAARAGQENGGVEEDVSKQQTAAVRRQMNREQEERRRPQRQQQQQPQPVPQEQAPPMGQSKRSVGMPTPADLGVVVSDQPEEFPASGSESVKG